MVFDLLPTLQSSPPNGIYIAELSGIRAARSGAGHNTWLGAGVGIVGDFFAQEASRGSRPELDITSGCRQGFPDVSLRNNWWKAIGVHGLNAFHGLKLVDQEKLRGESGE